jgi:hypothetical protein
MQRIAVMLGLDPLEVIRRNLVDRFPYRCPAGAVFDSGDYRAGVDQAIEAGGLAELHRRRNEARKGGRVYGIGYAAVVEPSISNMGYITTVLTPTERRAAGPKNGAQAAATVALDPLGGVSVIIDSLPQGQGHRTVTAQVGADVFALNPTAPGRNCSRHWQRRLVDRRRQLFEPLRRGGRRGGSSCGTAPQGQTCPHCRSAIEPAAGRCTVRRRTTCFREDERGKRAELCPRLQGLSRSQVPPDPSRGLDPIEF